MIYLDNAATTFPKPASALSEVASCIGEYCGNPGRSSHRLALLSAEKIYECREALSALFGLGHPENVVFTQNATHALNITLKGLLSGKDHVILSDMEHNSVYRPILALHKRLGTEYDVFPTHPTENIPKAVRSLIRKNTKLLVCAHCPNISSVEQPIAELGELCRQNGIIFVVDGAQSAGHLPIDMQGMGIDALCVPGHKGLYGIQGSGALLLRDGILPETLTEGGNGLNSLDGFMPELPPERYESGTLPTPSIASLCAGINEIERMGIERIHEHEVELWRYAFERLCRLGGVTIYEPHSAGSVLLFNLDNAPPDSVSSLLGKLGICVRGGFHCSALGHKTLHTARGGAVRASFGIFNTKTDVDGLVDGLWEAKAFFK